METFGRVLTFLAIMLIVSPLFMFAMFFDSKSCGSTNIYNYVFFGFAVLTILTAFNFKDWLIGLYKIFFNK